MSDENESQLEQFVNSRRSFLQKGAVGSGVAALGLGGMGLTGGQEDDETDTPSGDSETDTPSGESAEGGKALMFNDEFRPGAQFRVKSPIIEQNPDVRGVEQGDIFSEYNTRIVEYLNTDEDVYFFPAHDAEVEQGVVYQLSDNFTLFEDDAADSGIIDVRFNPVDEEGILFPSGDNQQDPLDDFGLLDGGGKALIQASNFFAGALVQITSGVVDWTPRPAVQGSDIFSEYNTRHARYLNTNDEFLIYTAQAGEFEQDGIYLVRDEFDITDPEGQLVTADLDRVNESDLDDELFNGN